jgi:hypothetical protein
MSRVLSEGSTVRRPFRMYCQILKKKQVIFWSWNFYFAILSWHLNKAKSYLSRLVKPAQACFFCLGPSLATVGLYETLHFEPNDTYGLNKDVSSFLKKIQLWGFVGSQYWPFSLYCVTDPLRCTLEPWLCTYNCRSYVFLMSLLWRLYILAKTKNIPQDLKFKSPQQIALTL